MAFWNVNEILDINEGTSPNSGNGDTIRDAFFKVDSNFSNISTFLAQPTIEFLNANVGYNINANSGNINTLTVSTVSNTFTVTGNINMSGNVVPTVANYYDLGSSARPFKTLYVATTVSTTQVQTSSDAGLLVIHANANPGDDKDVGILGNISSNYPSGNMYAFFGHQFTTNNFVYKITPNNAATMGNSVVYDGVYGNVQFGSLFLSNSSSGNGNTFISAGSAKIDGNIFTGNVYGYGGQFLTTTSAGIGQLYNTAGNVFTAPLAISDTTQSTSTVTGALRVAGGAGIVKNLYVGGDEYVAGNLAITGNATFGQINNLTVNGSLSMSGAGSITATTVGVNTVTATIISTSTLTGLSTLGVGGTITTNILNAATIGNLGAVLTGTLSTAAQTNITSVGTLTSLAVTGNITGANVIATQYGNALGTTATYSGNVTAANINAVHYGNAIGTIATYSGNVTASYILANGGALTGLANNSTVITINANVTGTNAAIVTANTGMKSYVDTTTSAVTTAWQANAAVQDAAIVSLRTNANANTAAYLTTATITTTGNITGSYILGNGSLLTGLPALYGNTQAAAYLTVYSGNISGNLTTAAQTNITSVGTLTGLTLSGGINTTGNTTANIGSSSNWFGNVHAVTFRGTSITAQYADLAEMYLADNNYDPGTVVMFGGEFEVTVAEAHTTAVAGIVSTNPAYVMNNTLTGTHVVAVALTGRVPCLVTGPVRKGDLMIAGIGGTATSISNSQWANGGTPVGVVIGKAIENFNGSNGVIEVAVGRY